VAQAERVEYVSGNITSCTELRTFWVGWENGVIEVGRGGELGQDRLMTVTDNDFPGVNYLAISTGWGSEGVWVINDDLGMTSRHYVI